MNWEKIWDKVICGLAAVGGGIAGAFGGWDTLLAVLMSMMAADYISGIVVAAMGRSLKTVYGGLSSKVGAMGLAKKGLMLLVVLVAAMLDKAMGADHAVCRDAVCWFYVANEGLSLLENLSLAGVPFPQKLKELLGQRLDQNSPFGAGGDSDAFYPVTDEEVKSSVLPLPDESAAPVDWDGDGPQETVQMENEEA